MPTSTWRSSALRLAEPQGGRGRRAAAARGARLPGRRRSRVQGSLGGTRQKLNLALALLGDPEVLLLDEPYQGFDTGSYVNFWDHVSRWRAAGRRPWWSPTC